MEQRSVVMMGASGAVGGEVVTRLVAMSEIGRITLLGRRAIELPADAGSARVAQRTIDVHDAATYRSDLSGHSIAICTLGVGQPSKVSHAEFVKLDKDAVLAFARECKIAGVAHFELLGAAAANPASRSKYLRTKGELVAALQALNFERLSIFQPSMILTPHNRYGLAQGILLKVWPKLDFMLRGSWRKWRGIPVARLGTAMAHNVLVAKTGFEVLHTDEFLQLA